MQGFEEEADFLGLVLGQDRLGRIAHRDRLALGDQRAQLFYASLEPGIGFLQRQLLLRLSSIWLINSFRDGLTNWPGRLSKSARSAGPGR